MPPPVLGEGYATATNGGGPQVKQSSDVVVVNHTSQSSGDDSLAFFGIQSGLVTGCNINDGWGAGILLSNNSKDFRVFGNIVRRAPIYFPDKTAPSPAPVPSKAICTDELAKCVGVRKCKGCAKQYESGVGNCTMAEVQAWMKHHCESNLLFKDLGPHG